MGALTTFADTSALYALLDRDDDRHRHAARAFEALAGTEVLVSHSYVCLECATLAQRRIGVDAVRTLLDEIVPALEVEWVDEVLHREAQTALLAAGRRDVSFVDWTSFALMRRRGISTAFAYDDDFVAQGFTLVA